MLQIHDGVVGSSQRQQSTRVPDWPNGAEQPPADQHHLPVPVRGGPTHWYQYLAYYKLYWVVAGVWALNLTWSSIWLRPFQFGPVEWVWRSLTYWHKQPMRLKATA